MRWRIISLARSRALVSLPKWRLVPVPATKAGTASLPPAPSPKDPGGPTRLGHPLGPAVLLTLVCLATLLGMSGVASAQWTDVTSGPLGDPGAGASVAWGDYDNDGDLDLYITNLGTSTNKLFRNDGGTWVDATGGPLGDSYYYGVAWGDYDNDGDLDLYAANANFQGNKLFRNDGGTWVDATSGPLGDTGIGQGVAWGDYDNDGDLDLYITNYGQANKLFRNDGGTWVDATSGPLGDVGPGFGAAWGDYDNDGDLDLYLANYLDANKLFRNDGGGTFVDATSGPLGDTGAGRGVAWGDYDNDGDLDLYLANGDIGGVPNKLFRNDGGGTFVDATSGPLGNLGNGFGAEWGDYDNDGDLDLYLVNLGPPNPSKLFRNDGGGTFVDATSSPLGAYDFCRGAACGDYDNDGDLDLYLSRSGANKLFRNDLANGNHWLEVKLVGTVSNRSGIGARVRVVAGGVSRIQEVSGGSLSQNSLTAEFGLGASTTIDSLIVRWPSGIVQPLSAVGVDRVITVIESSAAGVEVATLAPWTSRLLGSVPNPFRSETTIGYELAADSPVRLWVFDINGRIVRQLENTQLQKAGRHATIWDGRDAAGVGVPAGVYFYRLEAGSREDSERFVIVQ